jgi:hypothetical protein
MTNKRRSKKGRQVMAEQAPDRVIFRAVNFGELQDAHDQAKDRLERSTELLRKAWDAHVDSQKAFNQAREQLVSASRTLFSF